MQQKARLFVAERMEDMEVLLQIGLMALGFLMLLKGADWFVDGASGIATRLGIPQLVIGLTIVAMGTSTPEAAVSISSAIKGNADITIGNVVGSNILNILIILGLTALIVPVRVAASTIRYEIPYMILITLVLLGLGYTGEVITFGEGIILWAFFGIYIGYLLRMAKKQKETPEKEKGEKGISVKLSLLFSVVGLSMVVAGSSFAVDGATAIAKMLGVSDRFIGLTIVALGTSLPELVTSLNAAMKGNADIAMGNIVGSNIFNILFIVGTSALILPISFAPNFVIDTLIAAVTGGLLFLGCVRKKELTGGLGILMLLCYAGYFIWLMQC